MAKLQRGSGVRGAVVSERHKAGTWLRGTQHGSANRNGCASPECYSKKFGMYKIQ